MFKNYPKVIPTLLFFIPLFLGGFWGRNIWFDEITCLYYFLILSFIYFKFIRLQIPKTFIFYIIFLLFFFLTLLWSKDVITSAKYFFIFLSGGFIWLIFYNLQRKKELLPNLEWTVIFLGIVFGIWFLYKKIYGIYDIEGYNLISYSVKTFDHHHIGDLWAVVMGVVVYGLFGKKTRNIFFWFLALFGLYLLTASFSRSAYFSLGVGMGYLLLGFNKSIKKNIIPLIFFLFVIFIFIFVSANKGLISHRLFYVQGLIGIFQNPFGVGVGNFSFISLDPSNHLFGISGYSGVADNIFLEILTGMGILGTTFVYWFVVTFRDISKIDNKAYILPRLIFVILTVNFLFNYVYLIPTMLWIWFSCIGLLSNTQKKLKNV